MRSAQTRIRLIRRARRRKRPLGTNALRPGRFACADHAGTRDSVSETGTLRRHQNQDHTQEVQCRKRVNQPEEVPTQAPAEPRRTSSDIDDPQPERPFTERRPRSPFQDNVIPDHDRQKGQAQRVRHEPTITPPMIGGAHQPDPLDQSGDREKHRTKKKCVDDQSEKAGSQSGILQVIHLASAQDPSEADPRRRPRSQRGES